MKVALLAVATNIHTMRWVNALAERDIPVMLITQQPPIADSYHPSVEMAILPYRGRFAYALNAPALRRLFRRSASDGRPKRGSFPLHASIFRYVAGAVG